MAGFFSQYRELEGQLEAVAALMDRRLRVRNSEIAEALVSLNRAGGKYLRPAFFFLFASFGDEKRVSKEEMVKAAASLEMLHLATLVHDDIIDDSPLRRGTRTIQSQFGKDIAVYTGDFLFTVFFELLVESMAGTSYLATNARTMRKILVGELDQMTLYYQQDQTIHDYLRAVAGKTAALFKLAAREGAYFGGASPEIVRLAGHIGFYIGIAFQILDDILDYTAEKSQLNKPVLEDVSQGIYSLPLLLALAKNPTAIKPYLDKKSSISDVELKELAALVVQNGGVEEAQAIALKFTNKAISSLEQLPQTKSKEILNNISQNLLTRKR